MTRASLLSHLGLEAHASPHDVCVDVSRECLAEFVTRAVHEFSVPLSLMYATDERKEAGAFFVHAVLATDAGELLTLRSKLPADDPSYPSVTKTVMAAHWYERLMGDQFGIIAQHHPDWRRLMHHSNIPLGTYPLRKDFAWNTKLPHANEPYPMHAVEGEGIYEIPVGPIHAGIIEPGHFRFNVRGERILTLEGKLFFTHKGVEKLLEGRTPEAAMPFVERVSGNMAVAHALAFCQAVECATGTKILERAAFLRTFFNELERVTMHIFDMGNIGGNGTGFTFMAAQGFRVVEQLRRLCAELTGYRYLCGIIIPGGVARDISQEEIQKTLHALRDIERDFRETIDVAYATDGLMERFETTGVLKKQAAIAYGAKGLPARASGVDCDVRRDRPYAAYDKLPVRVMTRVDGDVRARFDMRVLELAESFRLIRECLAKMPEGSVSVALKAKQGSGYGLAEGWLGEVLDWVRLDADGCIDRCVIRDPSFCNWPLFGEIGPGNIVPDFPLCNKSLNLSYSGTDM